MADAGSWTNKYMGVTKMEKGYAYRDKYGVIHVVDNINDAKEFAKWDGKIIEFALEHGGGYPMYDGRAVIVYTDDVEPVVKHAGIKYEPGKWPAGTNNIKTALKELL